MLRLKAWSRDQIKPMYKVQFKTCRTLYKKQKIGFLLQTFYWSLSKKLQISWLSDDSFPEYVINVGIPFDFLLELTNVQKNLLFSFQDFSVERIYDL